ncbi:MAG: membrane protein insertion efficiency factor YidD [Bdellovibrionales bacterium CG10_big_fil_rev_8_21_14_0_10_45_34]|nr:MAG: membrane protein insertion efficiency factor YidD [Bdellovibrionales bacterium CG10_big_fil_rev_8_21_14_0_10_45_34]
MGLMCKRYWRKFLSDGDHESINSNSLGAMKRALLFCVRVYQIYLRVWLPSDCRFYPTCSNYANECLHKQPTHRALYLIGKRLLKCRPFGPSGFDAVPQNKEVLQTKMKLPNSRSSLGASKLKHLSREECAS